MRGEEYLWSATVALVDRFAVLGGAARYSSMTDEDICRYVACRTLDLHEHGDLVAQYVDPQLVEHAGRTIDTVDEHLIKVDVEAQGRAQLIDEYLAHFERKLAGERTSLWTPLRTVIRERCA